MNAAEMCDVPTCPGQWVRVGYKHGSPQEAHLWTVRGPFGPPSEEPIDPSTLHGYEAPPPGLRTLVGPTPVSFTPDPNVKWVFIG